MLRQRVLIVEDDRALAAALATVLRSRNYLVSTADTCSAGLAALYEDPPALLVLDIVLPDGDGWQILASAQESGLLSALPVVVISGNHISHSLLRQWGIFRFLPKPFEVKELLETVDEALKQNQGKQSE